MQLGAPIPQVSIERYQSRSDLGQAVITAVYRGIWHGRSVILRLIDCNYLDLPLIKLHRYIDAESVLVDRLLRNERYLSLSECEVVGDLQQSSGVTTMHASRLLSDE